LKPRPDTPSVVRRLPTPRAVVVQPLAAVPSVPSATRIGATTPAAVECRRESLPEPQPAPVSIAPPAPERYRIQLTVSRETRDRFRRPGAAASCGALGDAAEIFDRTVTLLVDQLSRVSARPSATVSVESREMSAESPIFLASRLLYRHPATLGRHSGRPTNYSPTRRGPLFGSRSSRTDSSEPERNRGFLTPM
jgi:hypothetical protein